MYSPGVEPSRNLMYSPGAEPCRCYLIYVIVFKCTWGRARQVGLISIVKSNKTRITDFSYKLKQNKNLLLKLSYTIIGLYELGV